MFKNALLLLIFITVKYSTEPNFKVGNLHFPIFRCSFIFHFSNENKFLVICTVDHLPPLLTNLQTTIF